MSPPTILLVEDNAITRKLVRFALESQAMRVIEAPDGRSALRSFPDEPISLVLQDLCLPDLDGFELVRRLRALPGGADVPILAFSGMLTAHDEARVSAAGFDDLISKPVEPSRLVQIVRAHLPDEDRTPRERFGAGKRIIVADDDAVQRKWVAFKLQRVGFEVALADDGAEVLAQARRVTPDAVLSDVLMPRLDGFGLCTEMRNEPRLASVPVVLTTSSYVEAADRALALKAGARDLIHRTPDLGEVLGALRLALTSPAAPLVHTSVGELEHEHQQRMMRQLERQVTLNAGISQRCAVLSAEMAVLKGISEALASQGDLDDAVRQALAACFDAGGISQGALFLGEGAQRRVVSFGFPADGDEGELARLWGEPQLLDAVREGRVTRVLPQAGDPAGQRLLERAGAVSALLTPVGHHQVSFGVLLMMSKASGLDSGDRLAFAEAVAAQISQALAVASAFAQKEASERVSSEQAALLRSILESIGDAVMVADQDGHFIQWNAAAAQMVAMGPRDAAFRTVGEGFGLYGGDRSTPLRTDQLPLVCAMRGESVDGVEMFVRHPGAPQGVWLSASGRPWRDEQGRARGGVAVFRDVTNEKNTQSQLMASDRLASVGMLAAGVAHEINNPLSAVVANLELCRTELAARTDAQEGGELQGVREMIADAGEAADRVRQIVRDLRIFSRHEDATVGSVDIQRVLDSTLRMAGNEVRHRARVVKTYGPATSVKGTESRLGQVFLNLVVNAAQAIPEGNAEGNTIRVETRLVAPGRLAVEVIDTGPGMGAETLRNLFTPFFTTKAPGVGTGLGLAICQRIVTGYGGEIQVESQLGKGTTFRVLLEVAAASPGPLLQAAAQSAATRRGRVLLVDDEELVGKVVRRLLSGRHDVVAVTSANAALELLRGGAWFDVILSDLMMPQRTGIDFHRELALLRPGEETRIVFLTGGAFTEATRAFLDSVPNERIEKPFTLEQLQGLVEARVGLTAASPR